MSHLIAAIDESMRTNSYLMCATVASTADRPHLRQALRALLLPNQRRLHAHTEREGRRRMLLKAVTELDGFSCRIIVGDSRESVLKALATTLLQDDVREIVLEQIDDGTVRRDQMVLSGLAFQRTNDWQWRHEAAHQEPLLWISDLMLSAYGAGGSWRRAAEPRLTEIVQL